MASLPPIYVKSPDLSLTKQIRVSERRATGDHPAKQEIQIKSNDTKGKIAMNEMELLERISQIKDLKAETVEAAKERQAILAKPPGSLGKLEDISIQVAGITGKVKNNIKKKAIIIMCADNGVVEEGVASAPQSVTASQTINFTRRLTGVGSLAKHFEVDLLVVDMGIKEPIPKELYAENPSICTKNCGLKSDDCPRMQPGCEISIRQITDKIVDRRIRPGTNNLAKEPAMTREEAIQCLSTGLEMAKVIKKGSYNILGIGEMGIGNTTTSAAILSALTGLPAVDTVGKGGGLMEEGFIKKRALVDEVCARYNFRGQQDLDVIDVLAKVGGFDIAAMVGAFLGAGLERMPVVIDGYISAVAALVAARLNPKVIPYMIPSHESYEAGYLAAMGRLGLSPMLQLNMRLGEGSGCPLAFLVVEAACASMKNMATLEEGAIDAEYLEEIRKGDCF